MSTVHKLEDGFRTPVYIAQPKTTLQSGDQLSILFIICYEKQFGLFQIKVTYVERLEGNAAVTPDKWFCELRRQKGREVIRFNRQINLVNGALLAPPNWVPMVCWCSPAKKDLISNWITEVNKKLKI